MDILSFDERLKKINKNLYIDFNHRVYSLNPELGSSGIYLKHKKRTPIPGTTADVRLYNDQDDSMIAWCTHRHVPEGNVYDKTGRLIAIGWRAILSRCVKQNVCSKYKAEKVFGWEESDYDRMDDEQRKVFEWQQRGSAIVETNYRIP